MDRKPFILATLDTMTTATLDQITGLDIADKVEGKNGNLIWEVAGDDGSLRWAVLSDLKDMVIEAYEADAIETRDASAVLPFIENLRRETRLIDYMLIGAARRLAPLGGEYTVEIGSRTTVDQIISGAVQEVYDQAAQRLVQHLENEARNSSEVEQ